jgi:hypothetical protein
VKASSNSCARTLIFGSCSFIAFLCLFPLFLFVFYCLSFFPFFFIFVFVSAFRLLWFSFLAYPNLLETKRHCCCYCQTILLLCSEWNDYTYIYIFLVFSLFFFHCTHRIAPKFSFARKRPESHCFNRRILP